MSMTSPHAYLTSVLRKHLDGFAIRHGDRSLDALSKRPTVVLYTSIIRNSGAVRAGQLLAEITLLVFAADTNPDKLEDALFDALAAVIDVLNTHMPTLHWEEARRGIFNDMPAYQITTTIAITLQKGQES